MSNETAEQRVRRLAAEMATAHEEWVAAITKAVHAEEDARRARERADRAVLAFQVALNALLGERKESAA